MRGSADDNCVGDVGDKLLTVMTVIVVLFCGASNDTGWSREVAIGVDGNALSARPLSVLCFRAWTLGGESFIDKSRGSAREREHRPTSMLGGKSGRNLAIPFIYLEDIKRN